MATAQDDESAPSVRFKRRKITHPKRAYLDDETPTVSTAQSPDAAPSNQVRTPLQNDTVEEESVPNLKEILRNRRRPRDRLKEPSRKPEASKTELALLDAPRPDQYTSRFVAQTGQVVDRDDKQMTEYVEARLAEKNYRQYGWPIPRHLQAAVAAIAPDLKHTFAATSSTQGTTGGTDSPADVEHSNRLAAGQGKLQEVDLGPGGAARMEEDWKRLNATESEEPATKARKGKYGYQWRHPKRRNSDAERRDQMVEAVLKEAKLDYFDDTMPTNPRFQGSGNNDDAIAERFRAEYFEAMEEQQQRKPPAPPSGMKGVKEAPKGPKLGGSKSARAKMRLQEEQAAKNKR